MSIAGKSGLSLPVTRRAVVSRIAGASAAPVVLARAAVAVPAVPVADPDLRDAALRGLALAGQRGDPVGAAAAEAAIARLEVADPEGALLCRIYRLLDHRPSAFYAASAPPARPEDLALLHAAIAEAGPVRFGYTDLEGQVSSRTVLPLVLVHPPQGVKLLAWCKKAEGYRQFFVRATQDLVRQQGNFADRRRDLLVGLLEKESAWA